MGPVVKPGLARREPLPGLSALTSSGPGLDFALAGFGPSMPATYSPVIDFRLRREVINASGRDSKQAGQV